MKLLDTTSGNTKIRKTQTSGDNVRLAGLSLMPDNILCAGSKAAGCMDLCLKTSGLAGVFPSIIKARQSKTDFFHNDQEGFMKQLMRELTNFDKLCTRTGKQGCVRLNVYSDIKWEKLGVPQAFPDLFFYDYTKIASRLNSVELPSNYKLMFSYSGRKQYKNQVELALKTDVPVAVVFRGGFPKTFLDRPVIDGDKSDLTNVKAGKVVVGLVAKGKARKSDSDFIVSI